MTNEKEIRSMNFEIRAEENEQHGTFITGTPIVFNQVTDLGWIREVIEPTALDSTDLRDVRFLIGHNTSMVPLARSRNNNENSTMQLMPNKDGMDIRVDLDVENNADARTLYSAVKRGDMTGMSFMFTVDGEEWEDLDSDQPLRRVTSIGRVFEVSAVCFPAYEGTSLEAASEGEALDSVRASLESARAKLAEERAAQAEETRRSAVLERLNTLMEEVKPHEV